MKFVPLRKKKRIIELVCVVCGLIWVPLACRAEISPLEYDEAVVRSTFKIQSGNVIGTAFILVQQSTNKPNEGFYLLITAAHVLSAMDSTNATLWIRVKAGDTYTKARFEFPIKTSGTNLWVRHPEGDIAVMKISLPTNIDLVGISTDLLADDKFLDDYHIHPGDELRVAGYPYGFEANDVGFGVLRSGKISSFPLTPVSKVKTFLLDFPVFQGNSGGPVYISERRSMKQGSVESVTIFRLMGLVTEEAILSESVRTLSADSVIRHQLGLGIVIHAQLIKDTIGLLPRP